MQASFNRSSPQNPGKVICSSTTEDKSNSSISVIVDAGTQLIGYFYDPSRQGQVSLLAQGEGSDYATDRKVSDGLYSMWLPNSESNL